MRSGLMSKARSLVDLVKYLLLLLAGSTASQIARRMWVKMQSRSNVDAATKKGRQSSTSTKKIKRSIQIDT